MSTAQPYLSFGLVLCAAAFAAAPFASIASGCAPVDREFNTNSSGTGDAGLSCEPGSEEPCYEGPEGTEGVGICKPGKRTCNAEGTSFGACEAQVLPATEACETPEDDDCDGIATLCPLAHVASHGFSFTNSSDLIRAVAFDGDGNILLAGSFSGELDVGVSLGSQDTEIFLVKLTPEGKPLWATSFGGPGTQHLAGAAMDKEGNVYVSGYFGTTVEFGNGTAFMTAGSNDVFVAKFDPKGLLINAIQAGDLEEQRAVAIRADDDGNILLTGTFTGSIAFPKGKVMTAGMETRVFVAKLDPDLLALATQSTVGMGNQKVTEITVGPQGAVLATGWFDGTIAIDGISQSTKGDDDFFVVKLGGVDLKPLWLKSFGGQQADRAHGVGVEKGGDIFVSGTFQAEMLLGADDLIAETEESMFVTRLSPAGDPIWAKSFGGGSSGGTLPLLRLDSGGNIVLSGQFSTLPDKPPVDFGGGPLTSKGMGGQGYDIFVAKLDDDGKHIASKSFGDETLQIVSAMAIGPADHIFISGATEGPIDFGGGLFGSMEPKVFTFFLAKLSP